jgi:signal transduction histidine kinase
MDGQKDHSVKVVKETAEGRGDWQVRIDPIRNEQILTHLLNNARDAMLDAGAVKVLLNRATDEIRVQVQDSGRGISKEEQDHVFEPFYRGENRKKPLRGLGIGLPFSRLIARSLGGDLELPDGTPGKTTFTLILPPLWTDQPDV